MAHNLQPQFLAFFAFAVVLAGQGLQGFGKADKAEAEGAVLQHFRHAVVRAELLAVDPDTLPHQERVVKDLFGTLDLEPVQELPDDKVNARIQDLIEFLDVPVRFDPDSGQVDGRETQVAAPAGNFAAFVVHVSHHARAAAHVGHLGVVVARLVVL